MTTAFPRHHLLHLGHVLLSCDLTGMEFSITLFTDTSMPLILPSPSLFYTPMNQKLRPYLPPKEPSGPDNEQERQDEPSENESEPPEDDQIEEEIDSNLVFLNPLEQREATPDQHSPA